MYKKYLSILVLGGLLLAACHNSSQPNTAQKTDSTTTQQNNNTLNKPVEIPTAVKELISQADAKNNANIRLQAIEALDTSKLYKEAINQIDKLISKDSLNSSLWLRKGQLLKNLPDTPHAIKAFEYAAKIYPGADQLMELANLLAETKNEKALWLCDLLEKNNPSGQYNSYANFLRGIYFEKKNNTAKAIDYFNKSIKQDYTFSDAYIELGYLYFSQKKYTEALQIFEKSTTVNNRLANGYYWQAKTYQALNQKNKAIEKYQKALQLDASITEAAQALEQLK